MSSLVVIVLVDTLRVEKWHSFCLNFFPSIAAIKLITLPESSSLSVKQISYRLCFPLSFCPFFSHFFGCTVGPSYSILSFPAFGPCFAASLSIAVIDLVVQPCTVRVLYQ